MSAASRATAMRLTPSLLRSSLLLSITRADFPIEATYAIIEVFSLLSSERNGAVTSPMDFPLFAFLGS